MKNLLFLVILVLLIPSAFGQTIEIIEPVKQEMDKKYKFYFDSPVKSIESIEYLIDGIPVKFKLDKEFKREVKLEDYFKRGTLKVKYTDAEGNAAEINRTPCDIVVDDQLL